MSFFTGIALSSFEMPGSVKLAPWAIVIVDTWMWTPCVMLICLAGLRSIRDYIYEAAEVDRASAWRQCGSITLPMVLPFVMLAVLFRSIENFKMFYLVNLLTDGGPGSAQPDQAIGDGDHGLAMRRGALAIQARLAEWHGSGPRQRHRHRQRRCGGRELDLHHRPPASRLSSWVWTRWKWASAFTASRAAGASS